MVTTPLLYATAVLPNRSWRQDVCDLLDAAPDRFEMAAVEEDELWVRILTNGQIIKLKARSNQSASFSVDQDHGALGALFLVALCERLGAVVYDASQTVVPFKPFNPNASWLAGVDKLTVAETAERFGLKPRGLKVRSGVQAPRLFS